MSLKCRICFEPAINATTTRCGHIFCRAHIEEWLKNETTCPCCRATTSRSALVSLYLENPHSTAGSKTNGTPTTTTTTTTNNKNEIEHVGGLLKQLQTEWNKNIFERTKASTTIMKLQTENTRLTLQLTRALSELDHFYNTPSVNTGSSQYLNDEEDDATTERGRGRSSSSSSGSKQRESSGSRRSRSRSSGRVRGQSTTHPPHGSSKLNDHPSSSATSSTYANSTPPTSPYIYDTSCPDELSQSMLGGPWELKEIYEIHSEQIHGCAIHPTLPYVATASWDITCKIYDIEKKKIVTTLEGQHAKGLYAVEFSKTDENIVGTVSSDTTCQIWDVHTGDHLVACKGHTDEVNGMAFHPHQNSIVATASDDRTIIIWDIEYHEPKQRLTGHRNSVYGLSFDSKGGTNAMLASVAFDWTTFIWDVRSGTSIRTLEGHRDDIIGVDFSPNGWALATGSDDGTCRIWDVRMWREAAILEEHNGEVKRIKFGPYGRSLITTSGDGTAKIWDMNTFQCTSSLEGHEDHVFDAAWSPDGSYVVTASHDKKWRLWGPEGK